MHILLVVLKFLLLRKGVNFDVTTATKFVFINLTVSSAQLLLRVEVNKAILDVKLILQQGWTSPAQLRLIHVDHGLRLTLHHDALSICILLVSSIMAHVLCMRLAMLVGL